MHVQPTVQTKQVDVEPAVQIDVEPAVQTEQIDVEPAVQTKQIDVEPAMQTTKQIDVQNLDKQIDLVMQGRTREKKSETDISVTKLKENLSMTSHKLVI